MFVKSICTLLRKSLAIMGLNGGRLVCGALSWQTGQCLQNSWMNLRINPK